MNFFGLALPVLLLAPVSAASLNVLVVDGGVSFGDSYATNTASQIANSTAFAFNVTVGDSAAADTLGELQAYDAIVIGDDGSSGQEYSSAAYAAMRAFLEAGGGVVSTGWMNWQLGTASFNADLDAITPVNGSGYNNYGSATYSTLAAHPVTNGLTPVDIAPHYLIGSTNALDAGASVLGTINGQAAIGAATVGSGRSVYLGTNYFGSSSSSSVRSGGADQLLEQAVYWASANAVAEVPLPATLPLLGGLIAVLGGLGFAFRRKTA